MLDSRRCTSSRVLKYHVVCVREEIGISCLKRCNRSQSLAVPRFVRLFLLPALTVVLHCARVA